MLTRICWVTVLALFSFLNTDPFVTIEIHVLFEDIFDSLDEALISGMSPICYPAISLKGKKCCTIIAKPLADIKHKFASFLIYIRIYVAVFQHISKDILWCCQRQRRLCKLLENRGERQELSLSSTLLKHRPRDPFKAEAGGWGTGNHRSFVFANWPS